VDFSKLQYILKAAEGKAEAVSIKYGVFIMSLIDFVIIALVIFLAVRYMNSLSKKAEEEPAADPEPSNEEALLTEIRDLLRK
jgi:large conductance mechanosensitive channel